jgi:ABC-type Zn uptake system ZnuABC Zn-binding protein ZnuA
MTTISSLTHMYEPSTSTVAAARASDAAMGLGPNQLKWLRGNIDSFKELEDQRRLMRQDTVRAARMAGLI